MKKTKIEGMYLADNRSGGSLAGYMTCSYKDLRAVLGPPNSKGDEYKVSTEWVLLYRGKTWTIYDYKETRTYDRSLPSVRAFRALPEFEWHIGGAGTAGIEEFKAAILSAINGATVH